MGRTLNLVRRCLLQLALAAPVAWCKCQYSRWPDAPDSGHFHRVCTSETFAKFNTGKAGRRCEVEAPLPPGKQLTVDTCEAVCSDKKECTGFVIRSPWAENGKQGNCWLLYEKDLPRFSRSVQSGGKDRHKKTFIKEFCDCEARYVHVKRQSRSEVYRIEKAIQAFEEKDLAEANETLSSLNLTLVEKIAKRDELLASGGGGWMSMFGGDSVESLNTEISKLKHDTKNAERVIESILGEIADKREALAAEQERLSPLVELEGVDDIYQWFPMPPETQANMELNKIKVSNIFLSEDKQKVLYRCDAKKGPEAYWSRGKSNWYVVTFPQILKALHVESIGDVTSMSTLKKVNLYLYTSCVGFQLQGGVDGARMCHDGECLPVTTLSDMDANVGCHKTAAKANAKREELVIEHMVKDIGEEKSGGDAEEVSTTRGCPVTQDVTSKKIMEWAAWAEDNPGYVGAALTTIQWAAYFTSSIDWSAGTTTTYMRERLGLILKHFVPVIAAIRTIDGTEDMWVKIACSSVMLKGIQNMQGIFPKLAQNLAMRPDMITDDYARDKLKETQSENPQLDQADVEAFVKGKKTELTMGSGSAAKGIPIFEAIKYKKLLAAGSVGQVLLYEVLSDDLRQYLRREGVRDDMVILKVVFEETEKNYKSDWTLLEVFFKLASTFGELGTMASLWDFLRPMRESIFNEFDLKVEGKNTAEGRAMLHEFTKMVEKNEIEGLTGVRFTAPVTLATSSPYALIQSIAPGTELKNYLIEAVGLPGTLATWRQTIYRGILHVYGFMAMSKGFFQADPHNGNWFVDDKSEKNTVVTLIDWGGVERLEPIDHCRLTEFYYKARAETRRYDRCSSVQVSIGTKRTRLYPLKDSVEGEYTPAGLSVFPANDERNLPSVLMGFSAAYKYTRLGADGVERVLHFDGERWKLSEVCKGRDCESLYQPVLSYKYGDELQGDPRDPLSASQQEPEVRTAGHWWSAGGVGSLWLKRHDGPDCQPDDVLANDELNTARAIEAFSGLADFLGLNPAPERQILNVSLAVAATAFNSDAALIARIGLKVYEVVQHSKLTNEPLPDMIPRIAPEWVLLVRCLAVFQGMLFDVLKSNIPPKLPQEYLEWFLDPSSDELFKFWAGYAERANVLDGEGKCTRSGEEGTPTKSALIQQLDAELDSVVDKLLANYTGSPAAARSIPAHKPGAARQPMGGAATGTIARH